MKKKFPEPPEGWTKWGDWERSPGTYDCQMDTWVREYPWENRSQAFGEGHEWSGIEADVERKPGWYLCGNKNQSYHNWTWIAEPGTPISEVCAIAIVLGKLD